MCAYVFVHKILVLKGNQVIYFNVEINSVKVLVEAFLSITVIIRVKLKRGHILKV